MGEVLVHTGVAMTHSLAQEVAAAGITFTAVLPGDVDTAVKRWGFELEAAGTGRSLEAVTAAALSRIPLGRLATPDDVAGLPASLRSSRDPRSARSR